MKEHLIWLKRMLGTDGIGEENADVLRRMADDGDDLTVPRDVDFNHLFASKELAVAFDAEVRRKGFEKVDQDFWPEMDLWLTTVQVRMVPNLDEITATEKTLNEIAAQFSGEPDGWGCMEMVPTPAR
jgi:hypothetical protein